jgi:DNA-binding response OmpR family regulator
VIDDDPLLLALIGEKLRRAGAEVTTAGDGRSGLDQFQRTQPDLVLIDVMMPGMGGYETCRRLRERSEVPIMMLTGMSQERAVIAGLGSGADHYLTKPTDLNVLVARLAALLRRAALPAYGREPTGYEDDYLKIDLIQRQVWIEGQKVKLTLTEYRVLACLVENAGQLLTWAEILECAWGPRTHTVHYVHTYVSRLRHKLEADPKQPRYLLTLHEVGYRFQPQK